MAKSVSFRKASLWPSLRREAEWAVQKEPALKNFLTTSILQYEQFSDALAALLAGKLAAHDSAAGLGQEKLQGIFSALYAKNPELVDMAKRDLIAVMERDPASVDLRAPFLYFKGYQAIAAHRIAHAMWNAKRRDMARYIQSLSSERLGVDIHPAVKMGHGIMIDHATGVVIGETAVIGNDVSMLHGVTLGGTGKEGHDRHPKIGDGVLLGAAATVLGNIVIGKGSRVAAGSVVLHAVPPNVTVAGIPAQIIGKAGCAKPGTAMDQIVPVAPETSSGRSRKKAASRR